MRKNPWVTMAMMLFFITVAYVPGGSCAEDGGSLGPGPAPVAFFPEKVFDFGLVLEGKEITHDFVVQNKGTSELSIENVKPG